MNDCGWKFFLNSGFSFSSLYKYIICNAFNNCLLYSCSLFTWISKMLFGFNLILFSAYILLLKAIFLAFFISWYFNLKSLSSLYFKSFSNSGGLVIQPLPIDSSKRFTNSGFDCKSHRLCVIPFVLLLNLFG